MFLYWLCQCWWWSHWVAAADWSPISPLSVKRQHQRSERSQPAGSPLGVRRGSDAETETGGERLVRSGTATVQLPATVRLMHCVCVCDDFLWCLVWCLFLSDNQYGRRLFLCGCFWAVLCICVCWIFSWNLMSVYGEMCLEGCDSVSVCVRADLIYCNVSQEVICVCVCLIRSDSL